jgi:hypothetical protein
VPNGRFFSILPVNARNPIVSAQASPTAGDQPSYAPSRDRALTAAVRGFNDWERETGTVRGAANRARFFDHNAAAARSFPMTARRG